MSFDIFINGSQLPNSNKIAMKKRKKECEAEQVTRKKKVDNFALLPDDILIEILTKLPPDILRYKVRFVNKRWLDVITNKILSNHASLILEKPFGCNTVRLIDITEEKQKLTTKEQYVDIPYNGRIKSWCNEFLLITDLQRDGSFYIYNLITKKGSFLPTCSTSCGGHYSCKCGVGLSFDEFKGVYKVVHVFMGPPLQCDLLLLRSMRSDGIQCISTDTWKKINGSFYMGQRQYFWDDPVSVQGRYFHWDVHCSKYLVSMDTIKERFRKTYLPVSNDYPMNNHYSFVEMGGFLALLHEAFVDQVNIWVLKDFQRMKWEKLQSISVSSYLCSSVRDNVLFCLLTTVRSKRYLIFRKLGSETGLYSYDLKDKVMKRIDIDIVGEERCVVLSTTTNVL